MIISVATA